jgi:chorismate-pyruvate lyase
MSGSQEFDPFAAVLAAPADRPPRVQEVDLRNIDPFWRVLLAIDGTVTEFIEAYKLEPVVITAIHAEERLLPEPHAHLQAEAGTRVVGRQVTLVGKYSRTLYAVATSLTIPNRLPREFKKELRHNESGIGQAIRKVGLESRREILWFGLEVPPQVPQGLEVQFRNGCLVRAYLIITGHRPAMLIHERFPGLQDGQTK